jgi:hypothetical protein
MLQAAKPYDTTGKASALPIVINAHHELVWKNAQIPFAVARGQVAAL